MEKVEEVDVFTDYILLSQHGDRFNRNVKNIYLFVQVADWSFKPALATSNSNHLWSCRWRVLWLWRACPCRRAVWRPAKASGPHRRPPGRRTGCLSGSEPAGTRRQRSGEQGDGQRDWMDWERVGGTETHQHPLPLSVLQLPLEPRANRISELRLERLQNQVSQDLENRTRLSWRQTVRYATTNEIPRTKSDERTDR